MLFDEIFSNSVISTHLKHDYNLELIIYAEMSIRITFVTDGVLFDVIYHSLQVKLSSRQILSDASATQLHSKFNSISQKKKMLALTEPK